MNRLCFLNHTERVSFCWAEVTGCLNLTKYAALPVYICVHHHSAKCSAIASLLQFQIPCTYPGSLVHVPWFLSLECWAEKKVENDQGMIGIYQINACAICFEGICCITWMPSLWLLVLGHFYMVRGARCIGQLHVHGGYSCSRNFLCNTCFHVSCHKCVGAFVVVFWFRFLFLLKGQFVWRQDLLN